MMTHVAEICPGHLIKSQQRGDPDLTLEQKVAELGQILESNPAAFLRRFRAYFKKEHLSEFDQYRTSYEVGFLLGEIEAELDERKSKTRIRNRRFKAMKELGEDHDFFSSLEMRRRNPALYADLVEANLTEEEIGERRAKEMEEERKSEEASREKERTQRQTEEETLKGIDAVEVVGKAVDGLGDSGHAKNAGTASDAGISSECPSNPLPNGDIDMKTVTDGNLSSVDPSISTSSTSKSISSDSELTPEPSQPSPIDLDLNKATISTSQSKKKTIFFKSHLDKTDQPSSTARASGKLDNTTLSQYLLKCYDEKETSKYRDFLEELGGQEEEEEDDEDEEEEKEDDVDDEDAQMVAMEKENKRKAAIPAGEKAMLEAEFQSRMQQQFIGGGDRLFGVDYARIDEDENLDDLEAIGRDMEDKWFDDDEVEETEDSAVGDKTKSDNEKMDDDEVDYMDFVV